MLSNSAHSLKLPKSIGLKLTQVEKQCDLSIKEIHKQDSNSASKITQNNSEMTAKVTKQSRQFSTLAHGMNKLSIHSRSADKTKSKPRYLHSVDDVASFVAGGRAKNIIAMVGAGISTPSGLPDFRSPGSGLYDNLKQYRIPYPEAIFELDYFRHNPRPFFTLAKELYPTGKYRPNYIHYFLKLLHDKGLLLRIYTQNIDGLERMAGIPGSKLVEAHGTFQSASCIDCKQPYPAEGVRAAIFADKIPLCKHTNCNGLVKPNIVFFGEDLPKRFHNYRRDFSSADLLLVMGTSLAVDPFAEIVHEVRFDVPRLLFNRTPVGPFRERSKRINDFVAAGDITTQVKHFVESLGWSPELLQLIAISETTNLETSSKNSDSCAHKTPETSGVEITRTEDRENATKLPKINSTSDQNSSKTKTLEPIKPTDSETRGHLQDRKPVKINNRTSEQLGHSVVKSTVSVTNPVAPKKQNVPALPKPILASYPKGDDS